MFKTLPRHRRSALASAVLAVLAAPALATDFNWTSGFFTPGVTAPSPLVAGDQLIIGTGGFKYFSAVTFTNQATVSWLADALYLQSGAVIDNQGLWDSQADTTLFYNGGAVPSFINSGTFRKSGGVGATVISANTGFVNSGTLDVQTGTLRFDGGSVFNAGSAFSGAGRVVMANGTNTFNGAFSSTSLVLESGTHAGGAAVLGGSVSFTGGTLAGGWTVGAGQTLNGADGGFKYLGGADTVLANKGTFAWNTSNALYLQTGALLSNQGLFVANADASILFNGGATSTFDNTASGTVRAAAGRTLSVGNVAFVNNAGTLDAQSGATINYSGGTSTFNAGTQFTGAGRNLVTSNAVFNGGFSSANLVLQNGNYTGNAAVLGGSVSFTGGTLAGGWTVGAGQTLNGADGGFKYLGGADTVLANKGTFAWNTSNALYLQTGALLSNQGLFVANADASILFNGGATSTFDNTASGTVRAAAGRTLSVGNVAFVNNAGTLDAQSGATINYSGGTSTFNAGTQFTGAGRNLVTSNAVFNGGFSSANLVLQNGNYTGNAAVLGGSVSFAGGLISGGWTVGAGQALNGADGPFKYLSGAGTVLTNKGTIAWNTGNALYLQSGALLSNESLFVANADASILYNGGATSTFDNTAAGTVRAAAGRTLTIGSVAFVNNGGVLDAQAGATINYSGGTSTFNAGTQFTGDGRNLVTNNAIFNGGFQSANLVLQNGTHTGNAAVVGGSVAYAGGTLSGSWTVGAGQTLNGVDGPFKYVTGTGSVLTNQGTVAWSSSNALYLQSGAKIVNQGVWDFSADGALLFNGGAAPSVVNQGLIVKSTGNGTATIGDSLGFDNQGTVDVRSGTIRLPTNFVNHGTLTGSGSFAVTGTLTNAGHVAPGASPGVLSISGNFVQTAAGVFDVDLNTLGATDLLNVSGTALLGGTLALHCYAACSLAVGDSIVILDSVGDLGGSFASMTLTGFGSGAFSVVYDTVADRVLLQVTQTVTAVPEPGTTAMLLAGLGVLAWLARRRRD